MKSKLKISALALSCACLLAHSASAQGTKTAVKIDEGPACHGPQPLTKVLNLSEDQMEKLKAVREKYHALVGDKIHALMKLHHEMASEIDQPDVSKETLLATQAKINAIQADLENNRVEEGYEASLVFTPEQKKQLHRMKLEREVAHEPFFGFGPPQGPPGFGGPPGLGGPPGPGGPMGFPPGPPSGHPF